MVYKKYYYRVFIRILLFFLSSLVFFYFLWKPGYMHLKFGLGAVILFQMINLIFFLNQINRKLVYFFNSIKTEDFGTGFFSKNTIEDFPELNVQLQKLSAYMQKAKIENEKQSQYFKAVIDHVATGILVFSEKGNIKFVNSAALDLFGLRGIKKIKDLETIKPGFSKFLKQFKPGQQELIEINTRTEQLQIVVKASVYIISDEKLVLISLQNIMSELEKRETHTWQDMIRILTHEIMNSISPITSLAVSLSKVIHNKDNKKKKEDISEKARMKLNKGLNTIQNRGEGLMGFVQKYRKLNLLPAPKLSDCSVEKLFSEVILLFQDQLNSEGILLNVEIEPPDLILLSDREQIEQVLINLIKNAIQALENSQIKKIHLRAFLNTDNNIIINVIDSGIGIKKEFTRKIFIPFYSTKENGDGIGLSLSRQIMISHRGSISVNSVSGKGSTFILSFLQN